MVRFFKYAFLVIITWLFLLPARGGAAELKALEIVALMQKTYENTANITAQFSQTTTLGFNQRQRKGSGEVTIEKSGRMRWDYVLPDRQVLVSDGKVFAMYIARDKQMITGDAGQYLESDITYAFLSGAGDIQRDFVIELLADQGQVAPETCAGYHLKLTPQKAHPQVDFLEVWVNCKSFLLDRIQVVDHFGSVTDLIFSNIQVDQLIADGFFSFSPPAGTEIIKQ